MKLTPTQFAALKEMMEMVARDVIENDSYSYLALRESEKRARKLLVDQEDDQ
jgi:hypothetical protein